MLVIFGTVCGAIVAAGVWELLRYRTYLLLCCAVGGLLCNVIEPTWDQIGHLWWYLGQPTIWTAYPGASHPTHYPVWCFIAYILYSGLISGAGASRAILITYLVPTFAVFYGAVLLGEPVTAAAVGGLALVLAGVGLGTGAVRLGRARRIASSET